MIKWDDVCRAGIAAAGNVRGGQGYGGINRREKTATFIQVSEYAFMADIFPRNF
ncbi:hypothetical protein [Aeromonas dhakensis]|uniref:hypothetical protein n=1 Tax=Aeromonas dhakensis TaxID=196024 RepID=UPI001F624A8F|nr:hypothetical protein [Aeromonas dhakensis]UNU87805.1 hypothetical protein GB930_06150 [Aeromonas dhakensis]WAF69870.1 hypothetical protein NRK98_07470 [Aeromonas dhakensis]